MEKSSFESREFSETRALSLGRKTYISCNQTKMYTLVCVVRQEFITEQNTYVQNDYSMYSFCFSLYINLYISKYKWRHILGNKVQCNSPLVLGEESYNSFLLYRDSMKTFYNRLKVFYRRPKTCSSIENDFYKYLYPVIHIRIICR